MPVTEANWQNSRANRAIARWRLQVFLSRDNPVDSRIWRKR